MRQSTWDSIEYHLSETPMYLLVFFIFIFPGLMSALYIAPFFVANLSGLEKFGLGFVWVATSLAIPYGLYYTKYVDRDSTYDWFMERICFSWFAGVPAGCFMAAVVIGWRILTS